MPAIPPQSQLETNSLIAKPDENGMIVSPPSTLPLFEMMREDWLLIPTRDPATPNIWHALFFSPGLWAIWLYRLSHALWNLNLHFLAKCIATFSRILTSIEIHPAARIGRRFTIDHGSGVVIGETVIMGDDCLLYQGVTLGGTGKELGKRHPTLGSNVTVGSGAKVLGNITVSDNCKIGAGSVVVKQVPADSTVIGVPGRVIKGGKRAPTSEERYPDVDAHAIRALYNREVSLETEVNALKKIIEQLTQLNQQTLKNCNGSNNSSETSAANTVAASSAGNFSLTSDLVSSLQTTVNLNQKFANTASSQYLNMTLQSISSSFLDGDGI